MNSKTLTIGLFVVVTLLGLMWWGRTNQTLNNPGAGADTSGSLTVSNTFYDFGTISMKDGVVSKNFTVTNSTGKDITLSSVGTSCMCTVAYIESASGKKGPFGMPGHDGQVPKVNEIIKAGQSIDLRVAYDPNAHGPAGVGTVDRFVYLTEESGKVTQIEIKANVTP